MPSLEVRFGAHIVLLSIFVGAFGVGILATSERLSHITKCTGRYAWFCDMLATLPLWAHWGFFIATGLILVYMCVTNIVIAARRRPILMLNTGGITFDFGALVFVPWQDVASFAVAQRAFKFTTRQPIKAKSYMGWRRKRRKIVVPIAAGNAYLDGVKSSTSADEVAANWLKNFMVLVQQARAQT
jgi:hypothetical protein